MKTALHLKISSYKHLLKHFLPTNIPIAAGVIFIAILALLVFYYSRTQTLQSKVASLTEEGTRIKSKLSVAEEEFNALKNEDQYLVNQELKERIKNIEITYKKSLTSYEKLLDLRYVSKNTKKLDALFAESLALIFVLRTIQAVQEKSILSTLFL